MKTIQVTGSNAQEVYGSEPPQASPDNKNVGQLLRRALIGHKLDLILCFVYDNVSPFLLVSRKP